VTHLDVDDAAIDQALEAARSVGGSDPQMANLRDLELGR
jgi:hypothetical protein